jgi:Leucine-rich repeat (LRR) protein
MSGILIADVLKPHIMTMRNINISLDKIKDIYQFLSRKRIYVLNLSKNSLVDGYSNLELTNNNSMKKLGGLIFDFTILEDNFKIQTLYLDENRFSSTIFISSKFKNITHLYLSNNNISTVTKLSLENLPHILSLDLSNNRISSLPSSISTLTRLVEFNISKNLMTKISKKFLALLNLLILNFEYNQIEEINIDFISSLSEKLSKFSVNNNPCIK